MRNSEKIKKAIEGLEASIGETIKSVKESKDITKSTEENSEEGQKAIEASIKGMQKINEREQAAASREMRKGVEVISQVVQENAASANELESVIENLKRNTEELENLVSGFKI